MTGYPTLASWAHSRNRLSVASGDALIVRVGCRGFLPNPPHVLSKVVRKAESERQGEQWEGARISGELTLHPYTGEFLTHDCCESFAGS